MLSAEADPRIRYDIPVSASADEPTETHELRQAQLERERSEQRLLEESEQSEEAAQHERRRDKAEYLKRKLAERERAERD